MSNVIPLNQLTTLDIPPSRVIENKPEDLLQSLVLGRELDGEFYIASSTSDVKKALYLVQVAERFLWRLLENEIDLEELDE